MCIFAAIELCKLCQGGVVYSICESSWIAWSKCVVNAMCES